jgi:hypothetical protein
MPSTVENSKLRLAPTVSAMRYFLSFHAQGLQPSCLTGVRGKSSELVAGQLGAVRQRDVHAVVRDDELVGAPDLGKGGDDARLGADVPRKLLVAHPVAVVQPALVKLGDVGDVPCRAVVGLEAQAAGVSGGTVAVG